MSVGSGDHLVAAVESQRVRRRSRRRHVFARNRRGVDASWSERARVRRVEVDGAHLGDAGRQVAEQARAGLRVDLVTRGQVAGDFAHALAETGPVFPQDGRVCGRGGCGGKHGDHIVAVTLERIAPYVASIYARARSLQHNSAHKSY